MIRRPPRSTQSRSSAASDVYKRQGGHTSRPHLTADLVFALGQVVTQVPAILSRRLDPRSGVNLTWGRIEAGSASNAIPMTGLVEGTLRCLDQRAWEDVGRLFTETVHAVLAPLGVEAPK